ncbi:MAG TPA: mechanosensitive ion channel family protein [Candidatus Poseidoniales archaeon]|nr:MAG TPA: mechanosensitive ion channel family protein [Candidatus Poseidoniales archaeon]
MHPTPHAPIKPSRRRNRHEGHSTARGMAWLDMVQTAGPDVFGTNRWTLLALLGLLLAGVVARALAMVLAPRIFGAVVRLPRTGEALKSSQRALGTAAAAGTVLLGLQRLHAMAETGSDLAEFPGMSALTLIGIAQFVLVVSLVRAAFRAVDVVQDVMDLLDDDDVLDGSERTVVSAVESVLRFLILFIGGVFVADAFGLDLTSLIAGLGISGLALALAAKDTISNFFGAMTVLMDRPFRIGDWVIVGGTEGEVIEINLRTTILRTSLDTVVTVPNANLVNTPVENFGKRRWRRWQTMLHLDLGSNPEAVSAFCDQVIAAVRANDRTLNEDASWCAVEGISAQSIDVAINLYWNLNSSVEEREAREDLMLDIVRISRELNLEFHDARVRQSR